MPNLYLTRQYYRALPSQTQKVPRERFVRYYNDLFDLEDVARPSISTFMTQGQYDFATLGNAVLMPAQKLEDFSQVDIFVVSYWGHEFDPGGSFGAYFSHQYGIRSILFDVCDQGILSSVMALHLIMAYAKLGKIKNAILLSFDQQSIPVEATFSGALPANSSARLLFLSTEKSKRTRYQLLETVVNQDKAARQKNASTQNIIIESGSPYYSSAELFSPLFDEAVIDPTCDEVRLSVIDSESNSKGSLLFKQIGSGRK